MEEQKKKIVDGAKQYSEYIVGKIPQRDENGNVKYYFSGSLAILLLNSAVSVKSSFLDTEGKTTKTIHEFTMLDKSKESLAKGIRPISIDVDVVTTENNFFANKGNVYMLRAVRENCDLATALCPRWENSYGTSYFDCLDEERQFKGHDVAEITMIDGKKVVIADPLALIMHKFADAIKCSKIKKRLLEPERKQGRQVKYQKDINDFVALFNGVVSLYPKLDFKQLIEHFLETCPQTAFSNIMFTDSGDEIKQFYYDAIELIDIENKEMFSDFINAIGNQNNKILEEQLANKPKM